MSVVLLTVLFFGTLVVLLLLGLPVAFSVGGASLIFLLWRLGPTGLFLLSSTAWVTWTNFILVTIPLFILMAFLLEGSGIADDLYEAMYRWLGPIRGGLAMGTVIICTIFAAMSGSSALGTLTMGLVALPSMQKRGYSKSISIGCISAGGTLAILIPPSIPMIFYAFLAQESVGQLFMGGILPGVMLALIFVIYIAVRCGFRPHLGPPVPKEERFTWRQKLLALRALVLPIVLILMVLGFMYLGVTTATEAAGIGAFGAFMIVIIHRRFSFKMFRTALLGTFRVTAMGGWIVLAGIVFSQTYASMGAGKFVTDLITGSDANRWVILIGTQLILLFMGCFMDPLGIMTIMIPIFVPIVRALGFDTVWFGILFVINLEIGYLTPPFGVNLFYMKAVAPKNVTMGDIINSIWPYVVLTTFGLVIVMIFPQIAIWIPNHMFK